MILFVLCWVNLEETCQVDVVRGRSETGPLAGISVQASVNLKVQAAHSAHPFTACGVLSSTSLLMSQLLDDIWRRTHASVQP